MYVYVDFVIVIGVLVLVLVLVFVLVVGVLNGTLIVTGGKDGFYDKDNVLSSVEQYNATTNQWTEFTPMITARHRHAAGDLRLVPEFRW